MALTPQYNNHYSLFGILEYLETNNLLKKIGGISAASGGSLPAAFLAAGKSYATFQDKFPKEGWGAFGPSEPKISADYKRFLESALPKNFNELKYPLSLSLTEWRDLEVLKHMNATYATAFAANSGDLHEAMTAAVATMFTSAVDPKCPYCQYGFWPKKVNGKFPVTDGAFGDIWGVKGVSSLPKCSKLLLLLPLDYENQVAPPHPASIDKSIEEMVTLAFVQTPVASHSYILEKASDQYPAMKMVTSTSTQEWNTRMFEDMKEAMQSAVSKPVFFTQDAVGHKTAVLHLANKLDKQETYMEQLYDRLMSYERDMFWAFWKDGAENNPWTHGDHVRSNELASAVMTNHYVRFVKDFTSGRFWPGAFSCLLGLVLVSAFACLYSRSKAVK